MLLILLMRKHTKHPHLWVSVAESGPLFWVNIRCNSSMSVLVSFRESYSSQRERTSEEHILNCTVWIWCVRSHSLSSHSASKASSFSEYTSSLVFSLPLSLWTGQKRRVDQTTFSSWWSSYSCIFSVLHFYSLSLLTSDIVLIMATEK